MYSAMQDRYEHRGVHCAKDLGQFRQNAKQNMHQLHNVRGEFETMLTLLLGFLEHEELLM